MFRRDELEKAIAECELNPQSYHDCEKLATFYTIQDHLYGNKSEPVQAGYSMDAGDKVGSYGDSEFLKAVAGMDARKAWILMDELLASVKIIQPRLYDTVLRKTGK